MSEDVWRAQDVADRRTVDEDCSHCHDDPPRGHTCPVCGRASDRI